jgi:hypothetical protein
MKFNQRGLLVVAQGSGTAKIQAPTNFGKHERCQKRRENPESREGRDVLLAKIMLEKVPTRPEVCSRQPNRARTIRLSNLSRSRNGQSGEAA